MIVTDEAFDELLERVDRLADDPGKPFVDDESEEDPAARRRDQFAFAVDRAVAKVVARRDRRVWYAQTLRRFGCRLHFFRSADLVYLVACAPHDTEDGDEAVEGDYST